MLNKKNMFLLCLALIAVAVAVYAVLWSKKIDRSLENDTLFLETATGATTGADSVEYLLSDFDGLLSGEDMSSLYDGEEGAFIQSGEINE